MTNEYASFSQVSEEIMECEIPYPSEDATKRLLNHDIKKIFEKNSCNFIDEELSKIFADIENVDLTVLDIIGSHMEKMAKMQSELIESTKRLFSALVNLKSSQMELVSAKKQQTIQLLTKIGNTINSISKIE